MQTAAVRAKLSGEQIPGLKPRALYMRLYRARKRLGKFFRDTFSRSRRRERCDRARTIQLDEDRVTAVALVVA
jgi:hypothetical protein